MATITLPAPGQPYVGITADRETSPLDLPAATVVALYKEHGALLLRGFATDLGSFRGFAQQFCIGSTFNESRGRKLLDEANNIQSVNRGVAPFPLHPELSREPWRPDVCFFGCLNPPRSDGATTICDGVEIVKALPVEVRRAFEGRRLLYVQPAMPDELAHWLGTPNPDDTQLAAPPPGCPYSFWRVQGQVLRGFTRPALHRPMFTGDPAFGNFLLFAHYLLGLRNFPLFEDGSEVPAALVAAVKAVSDRLTVPIAWQGGDLLMLDNSRFMHGRTAVRDAEERLIAAYFGYLNFAEPDAEEPAEAPWRRRAFSPPRRMTAEERAA